MARFSDDLSVAEDSKPAGMSKPARGVTFQPGTKIAQGTRNGGGGPDWFESFIR